jgi:hypothetical protein
MSFARTMWTLDFVKGRKGGSLRVWQRVGHFLRVLRGFLWGMEFAGTPPWGLEGRCITILHNAASSESFPTLQPL